MGVEAQYRMGNRLALSIEAESMFHSLHAFVEG
jgi:hypothetical protein